MTGETEHPNGIADALPDASACHYCAACCVSVGRPPFQPEEIAALPAEIQQIVVWFNRHDPQRTAQVTPCYFLNLATRMCLIYEHRPQACHEFRPDGQICRELRRAYVPCLDAFNADLATRH